MDINYLQLESGSGGRVERAIGRRTVLHPAHVMVMMEI